MRRRIRQLELALAGGFLIGPMVYALTLSAPAPVECPEVVVSVEACEVEPAVEVEPAAEVEPVVEVEPAVEPEVEIAVPPGGLSFSPRLFAFVDGGRIVLSSEAKPSWGHGDLFDPIGGDADHRAAKLADLERIPSNQLSQLGRRFDLYGREGKVCSVEIERLIVIAQYGWGLEGLFEGEDVYDPETGEEREIAPARIRRAVWKSQPKWLAGEFTADDCEGALWARDASLPAPGMLRYDDEQSELTKARRTQFRRSEQFTEARAYYEEYVAELDEESRGYYRSWKKLVAENPIEVRTWSDSEGQARFVEVHFGGDGEGCGDPTPDISLLDEVRGDEFVATEHGAGPSSIIDVDLDGVFEFLYVDDGYWYLDVETQEDPHLWIEEDFICPC